MTENNKIYANKNSFLNAHIKEGEYSSIYKESLKNNDLFWKEKGKIIDWIKPYTKISNFSYDKKNVFIKWYEDGVLNASVNCLDRHLEKKGNDIAIIWESDDPNVSKTITYSELHKEVCKFSNVLKKNGIKKGDRVTIYMPMIIEAVVAMLSCVRIGAIHSVVFGGFSPDALAGRILDCESNCIITADQGIRGGKKIPLKANVDKALEFTPKCKLCIVVKCSNDNVGWESKRDKWYHVEMQNASDYCPPEPMNAEDPMFILYTSGSTGKPKGVLHTTGGYMVYASFTHKLVFDYQEGEIYWCTADVGWVTGHSYIVYGPLANGASTLMFEGIPTWPNASRFWQIVQKHSVNIFYTAPTAIRTLMKEGNDPVKKFYRSSLRILGSVGEPINPEAWLWYYEVVGNKNCPIVDTWWQTETGGILISPLPAAIPAKPGSATLPMFGIEPVIVDKDNNILNGAVEGNLCINHSWPGQMRTVYGDHNRFIETYFSTFEGRYFTGDGAKRDEEGYYWITGRVDDVLNVSGHRMGTAEIESALVSHPKVAEAAVVGYPHEVKGEGIYAYVTLNSDVNVSKDLHIELINWVKKEIGPIAKPDYLQWAPSLPKTRSGKIMRRILRKIASNDYNDLGDTSTLAEPGVVKELVEKRLNR